MRAWHICPKWQMAIGAAAKCGSTMLADLVYKNRAHRISVQGLSGIRSARQGRECWSTIPAYYRVVMIVRDPIIRFASLLANIKERKRSDTNFYKQFEGLSTLEAARLLEKVGTEHDIHVHPQSSVAPRGREFETVKLEWFDKWWGLEFPDAAQPERLNPSQNLPEIEYPEAWNIVNDLYKDDVEVWQNAWGLVEYNNALDAKASAGG